MIYKFVMIYKNNDDIKRKFVMIMGILSENL